MRIECSYWGPNDYYNITFFDKSGDLWMINGGHIFDLVTGFLNQDYQSWVVSQTLEEMEYALVKDGIQNEYLKEQIENWPSEESERMERIKYIKADFIKGEVIYDDIKKFICDVLLLNEKLPLTTALRYSAFIIAGGTPLSFVSETEVRVGVSPDKKARKSEAFTIAENQKYLAEKSSTSYDHKLNAISKWLTETNSYGSVCVHHTFTSVRDVLFFFLTEMIINNYNIKVCANCGTYFVPKNRSDAIYCHKIAPQDKTKICTEYGKYLTQLKKNRSKESWQISKRIETRKYMKAKRYRNASGEDSPTLKADYEDFLVETARWKDYVNKGERTEAEYLEWLYTFNKKEA